MEYVKSTELYHHGVLGQKWGKRNGPPYPLKPNQHSAAEKKAGWQKSVKGGDGDVKKKKHSAKEVGEVREQNKASASGKTGGFFKDIKMFKEANRRRKEDSELKRLDDERNSIIDKAFKESPTLRKELLSRENVDDMEIFDSIFFEPENWGISKSTAEAYSKNMSDIIDRWDAIGNEVENSFKKGKTGSINRNDWSRTEVTPGSNPKSPRAMSDSELKEYNARAGMEKKYTDYTTPKDNSVQNANYVNQIANATRAATDNIQRSADNEYKNAVAREKAKIDLSNVSDAELRQAVNRMNLERQYRDLTPVEIKSGEEKFKAAMDVIGPAVATAASVATIASVIYAMTHG